MELAKGVRDYPPEIMLIREELFTKIRNAFARHGFAPFATPVIERMETLTHKFEGDEDVMSEIFKVTDQGERNLGLRFDLTVSLCRFISMNKDVKLPFKRYEIGRVYRDGPIKLGRYREFWQCDADIVGAPAGMADAECVKVFCDVLETLPFEYVVRVNNRKLLDAIMQAVDIPGENRHKVIITIDKIAKISEKELKEQLGELMNKEKVDSLLHILTSQGTTSGKLVAIEEVTGPCEGLDEMRHLMGLLDGFVNVEFDPSLARGLNYYTGFVTEAFLKGSQVTGSVGGGGRYDDMIGSMIGSSEQVPAVGISFGIEPLTDALLKEKHTFTRTNAQVFVAGIKSDIPAAKLADRLRLRGFATDLDVMGRSISKNLDYADKLGIPFVVIIGPRDVEQQQFVLRNMKSGEEHIIPLVDVETLELDEYL